MDACQDDDCAGWRGDEAEGLGEEGVITMVLLIVEWLVLLHGIVGVDVVDKQINRCLEG